MTSEVIEKYVHNKGHFSANERLRYFLLFFILHDETFWPYHKTTLTYNLMDNFFSCYSFWKLFTQWFNIAKSFDIYIHYCHYQCYQEGSLRTFLAFPLKQKKKREKKKIFLPETKFLYIFLLNNALYSHSFI